MTKAAVEVEGLAELLRMFGRVDRDVRKELSGELRVVARGVAAKAKEIAEANGLHETGNLVGRITISVRGGSAFIRDTARKASKKWPDGYVYPAVYEYGKHGQRAFLHPAVKASEPLILHGIEDMLDRLVSHYD